MVNNICRFRLLLKWHPDKNPGREKFASEVFKHLKKQIELYKTDPFLAGYYRSAYSSYSGFNTSSGYGSTAGATSGAKTDDYRSRHYGSFEDLHRSKTGSPGSGSPHSSPSREGAGMPGGYDYDSAKGPGHSNLGRTGSFRQEWERRRQQKRQNAGGSDPSMFYCTVLLDESKSPFQACWSGLDRPNSEILSSTLTILSFNFLNKLIYFCFNLIRFPIWIQWLVFFCYWTYIKMTNRLIYGFFFAF